jgi:hypothetical protein
MHNSRFSRSVGTLAFTVFITLVNTRTARGGAFTAVESGNWRSPATWGQSEGGSTPGDGDTVSIGDGVTVTISDVEIIGQSHPAGNIAIHYNTSGTLVIASGGYLKCRGDMQYTAAGSGTERGDYLLVQGGGILEWDSSLASSPYATKYSAYPSGSYGLRGFVAAGTANNHAVVRSNGGGGNGYFSLGGHAFGGRYITTYTDCLRIGDAANAAFAMQNPTGIFDGVVTWDATHDTFTSSGLAPSADCSLAGADIFRHSYNVHTSSLGPSIFHRPDQCSSEGPLTTGLREIVGNVFDILADTGLDAYNFTIHSNYFGNQIVVSVRHPWNKFQDNFYRVSLPQTGVEGLVAAGDVNDSYFFWDMHTAANIYGIDFSGTSAQTFENLIIDHAGNLASSPSAAVITNGPALTAGTYNIRNNILLPNSQGHASFWITAPIDTTGAHNVTFAIKHNTVMTDSESGTAVYTDHTGGSSFTGQISSYEGNILFNPLASGAAYKLLSGSGATKDICAPANCDYNDGFNALTGGAGFNGAVNGYAASFSGAPGAHDLSQDPRFVDPTRNLATFDSAYLGNTCPEWSNGASHDSTPVPSCVSSATNGVYSTTALGYPSAGAVINYRYTNGSYNGTSCNAANPQPGQYTDLSRACWEFATLYDIRQGLMSQTILKHPFGGTRRENVIATLIRWVRAGYAPANPALHNADADGADIGAEAYEQGTDAGGTGMYSSVRQSAAGSGNPILVTPSTPPVVPVGKTYTFTATGGSGSYTWSLAPGSVGSIDPMTGVYAAPATLQAKTNLGGCPIFPNDHIMNTRIDNLPVSSISANFIQNIVGMPPFGSLGYGIGVMDYNVIDNPTPSVAIYSLYNSLNNGSYQIPLWPQLRKEQGALISQNPIAGDQHYWMINRQTCRVEEMYNYDSAGKYHIPPVNADDATQFDSTSYNLPPGSSDSASGMQVFAMTLTLADLHNGAINHPLAITLRNGYIDRGFIWPAAATAYADYPVGDPTLPTFGQRIRLKSSFGGLTTSANCDATCQRYVQELVAQMKQYGYVITDGGNNWDIFASTDLSEDPQVVQALHEVATWFNVNRDPAIIRNNFELVDISSLEQKATVTFPAGTTAGFINHYFGNSLRNVWNHQSIFCADSGGNAVAPAAETLGNEQDALVFSPALPSAVTCTDYNDHSGLTDMNNGYVRPSDAARVIVTDSQDNVGSMAVSLQPVTVGIAEQHMLIQSGVSMQIAAWVNGTSNTGLTWSPADPSLGTLTTAGVFTPAAVTKPAKTSITATSLADPSSSATVQVTIIPAGTINMMAGPVTSSYAFLFPGLVSDAAGNYQDQNGNWSWNGAGWNHGGSIWADFAWLLGTNNGYSVTTNKGTSPVTGTAMRQFVPFTTPLLMNGGDILYTFHVPNGSYKVTFVLDKFTNSGGAYSEAELEVNGSLLMPLPSYSQSNDATFTVPTINFETVNSPVVTNNTLQIALRRPVGYFDTQPTAAYSDVPLGGLIISLDTTSLRLVFTTQPSSSAAGIALSPAVMVQVQDSSGNVITSSNTSVTITSSPSGVTSTLSAVNGIATFAELTFGAAGTYILLATSPGLTSAVSNPFNIFVPQYLTVFGQAIAAGVGLSGVTISVNGSQTSSTTTDSSGNYSVSLPAGGAYTLSAARSGYSFSGPAIISNLGANQTVNFAGVAVTGLEFYPVTPCRLVDTRVSSFQSGLGPPSMMAGQTRTFPIPSNSACGIPSTAAAYSLNVTVVTKGYLGILSMWPAGQSMPNVSTLNSYSTTSTAVANAAIVQAGANGAISVYVTDAADLIIDINGYFLATTDGFEFYPVTPCRLVDTRVPQFQSGFGPPSMAAGSTRTFAIPTDSACAIPATAKAYSLNITAVPRTTLGFLSIWPADQPLPNVSTLNVYTPGAVVANAAIVPAGTNGAINAFVTDATDLVIDINGYFAPAAANGLKFYPATPCRVADTRVASFPSNLGPPTMGAGTQRSFPVTAGTCGIPSGAGAYSFNFTAVPHATQLGIFITWPTGVAEPNVSTTNSYNGSVVANAAIVPAGSGGAISIYVTDAADVLFDVNGYFAP